MPSPSCLHMYVRCLWLTRVGEQSLHAGRRLETDTAGSLFLDTAVSLLLHVVAVVRSVICVSPLPTCFAPV